MKQHLKSYIELIVSFVHLINRNKLWPQQIRRRKQILPKQDHLCAHLHHLYFIILCYKKKAVKTRSFPLEANLLIITQRCLSVQREGQNEKSGRIFFRVARHNSNWQRVNQPFYTISKVNRDCLFSDLGQNLCHFLPYSG